MKCLHHVHLKSTINYDVALKTSCKVLVSFDSQMTGKDTKLLFPLIYLIMMVKVLGHEKKGFVPLDRIITTTMLSSAR